MRIDEILNIAENQGIRREVRPYNLNTEMELIKQIGQARKKDFAIDEDNKYLFENLIKWANGDSFKCLNSQSLSEIDGDVNGGIYIAGKTGTGKSWAMDILTLYCYARNFLFKSGNDTKFLAFQNIRTDKICEIYSESGMFTDFSEARIICFNDLADEPMESMFMGNRERVMKRILSIRGDKSNLITLITSNVPLEAMGKYYDDRVLSRLREGCNYFELKGRDRRSK